MSLEVGHILKFPRIRANLDLVQYIVLSVDNLNGSRSGTGYMRLTYRDESGDTKQLIR